VGSQGIGLGIKNFPITTTPNCELVGTESRRKSGSVCLS